MKGLARAGSVIVLLACLAPTAACHKNPEAAKRDYMAKADRYVAQNKLPEAIIEYRNAVNVDARFGEARFKLAEVYERQGDRQSAYREFIRAGDLLPGRDDVQLKAGQYMFLAQRFDDAKRVAEALLKKNAKNVDATLLLANSKAGLNDLPGAIAGLQAAIQLDPRRVDTYRNLARVQAATGDRAAAEATIGQAVATDPRSVDALLDLASIYLATGDPGKAETQLKAALAVDSKNVFANRALAAFYVRAGRARDAEAPLRVIAESSKSVGDRLALAEYYLNTNRSTDALPLLNAMASEKDGKVPATIMLARWEYASGQKEQAHKRVDQLLTAQPANASLLVLKAQLLSADGRTGEALARAEAAAIAAPRLADAQRLIGLIHLQRAEVRKALDAFTEALKLDPQSTDIALQTAKLQLATGRPDLARPLLEDVVKKQPQNLDARLSLARALLLTPGETARADEEVAKLTKEAPNAPEVQALIGSIALAKNNPAAARAAFAKVQELDKSSTSGLTGLVALDLKAGKPAEALARVSTRLAANPKDPALLELAGRAYMATRDAKKAEETWRKLIEVQPSSLIAYSALGQIFYSQGRLDDARAEFEQLTVKEPKAVGAHTLVGMILQMQNRVPDAQKRYEKALEINPNAAVAANNLAWLYAEQNANLDTALQLAQTAKSQMTESPEVDDTLGWVYYKKGLATLAISAFQQSLTRDPGNPSFLYHLGLAQLKNGDKAKAREALEKALKAKGDFPDAAEARRVLAGIG